jgi:ribosomal protein S18 acetylase RimI-like enzyme
MGILKVTRITNKDDNFYPLLGPFLSRRDIVSELGSPVWDDEGKEWFVVKRGRKVAGFAAVRTVGKHVSLVSAYVIPAFRGQGLYRELIEARLDAINVVTTQDIRATATEAAVHALTAAGFKPVGTRGSYTQMVLK